jgi:hypothetical protein
MLRQGRERVRKALDARFDVLAQQVGACVLLQRLLLCLFVALL